MQLKSLDLSGKIRKIYISADPTAVPTYSVSEHVSARHVGDVL